MRAIFPVLLLLAPVLAQQRPPAPARNSDAFPAQRQRLRDEAKTAFDREIAREKAGQCKNSRTTRDDVSCLNSETESTQGNFDLYARSLRALLALKNPGPAAPPVSGPTGIPITPEEQLEQFEKVVTAWRDYSKTACAAAYHLYKGGTIAPVMEIDCQQRLLRSHLRELEAVYGDYFSR